MTNIRDLLKKNGHLEKKYEDLLIEMAMKKGKRMHLKSYQRSGRHTRLNDSSYLDTLRILDAFDLKFEKGNDSPRGGKVGDYLIIKSTIKFSSPKFKKYVDYEKMAERIDNRIEICRKQIVSYQDTIEKIKKGDANYKFMTEKSVKVRIKETEKEIKLYGKIK